MACPVVVGLNAAIVAVTEKVPRILTIEATRHPVLGEAPAASPSLRALPYGPLDPDEDPTLELALRRRVAEQAGIRLGYVEQLYTFGDRVRDPRGEIRPISVAYLALVREEEAGVGWQDWYTFFPWEDWREGRPQVVDDEITPALAAWAEQAEEEDLAGQRRERAQVTFGLGASPWDGERVLERYELLYEAGLVAEAARDHALKQGEAPPESQGLGTPMALDHRRIAATALGRIRGKLRYRPVVFELVSPTFTLSQLQGVVEALAGMRLHTQNFRRLLDRNRLVEGTGRYAETGGRPAELYRFRREVVRERAASGVGLPELRPVD